MEARIDFVPASFKVQVRLFQTSSDGTHIFNLDGSVRKVVAPLGEVEPSAVMDCEVVNAIVGAWDPPRTLAEAEVPPEMPEDSFRSETKPSLLDAAKQSLREAERLEGRAFEAKLDHHAAPIEGMRDELLLGILQSNIAVAEALSHADQPKEDLRDEKYACDEEPRSLLEHVLDAIDVRLRHLETRSDRDGF